MTRAGDLGAATSWPSQRSATARPAPVRRDGRRSRDRLLAAAGELLTRADPFTLAEVAAAAGVSTATAYRHFASADDVATAFTAGFLDDVEERVGEAELDPDPERRLRQLCAIWVDAVVAWGPALAHLRSAEGFLARRARREPEMHRSLRHLEPTLRSIVGRREDRDDALELSYGLSVWNALADPREILDQVAMLHWSPAVVCDALHTAVLAVLDARRRSCAP